jgi:hypothetical protein
MRIKFTFLLMTKLRSCVDILYVGPDITYTYGSIIGSYLSETDMYRSNIHICTHNINVYVETNLCHLF